MTPSGSTEKLPAWIFFAADAVLVGAAWYLATHNPHPLPAPALFAITACVITGALLTTIPLVLNYEQRKNALLDDRQRALEALAATVASSAEQISIAAAGLHEIAAVAQKNLRQAEQLPQKLHEKLLELQASLRAGDDEEKQELERELAALRSTETERLEALSDKIAQSTREWKSLEATTRQHLADLGAAFAKSNEREPASTPPAAAPDSELSEKLSVALATIESKLNALANAVENANPVPFDLGLAPEGGSKAGGATAVAASAPAALRLLSDTSGTEPAPIPFNEIPEIFPVVPESAEPFPRQFRIDGAETLAGKPGIPEGLADPPRSPFIRTALETDTTSTAVALSTPPIAPSAKTPRKRTPRAPITPPPPEAEPVPPAPEKTATAQTAAETEAAVANEFSQLAPEDATPASAVAADGATRLLVTAYIGIGNRLFVRGDGPSMSWEKGIPLQFVSIGKWRWETTEATAPLRFKIFKNDVVECASLGERTLAPGRQIELTAAF